MNTTDPTTRIPTRHEFYAAVRHMTDHGWEHVMSVMDDGPKGPDDEFGLMYRKGDRTFWMNVHTIDNLPQD